jgi:hypothetical protein
MGPAPYFTEGTAQMREEVSSQTIEKTGCMAKGGGFSQQR